jgi:hypothetical protein
MNKYSPSYLSINLTISSNARSSYYRLSIADVVGWFAIRGVPEKVEVAKLWE